MRRTGNHYHLVLETIKKSADRHLACRKRGEKKTEKGNKQGLLKSKKTTLQRPVLQLSTKATEETQVPLRDANHGQRRKHK